MTAGGSPKPILFLDFDGTVTARDVIDAILEAYADPRWLERRRRLGTGAHRLARLLARASRARGRQPERDRRPHRQHRCGPRLPHASRNLLRCAACLPISSATASTTAFAACWNGHPWASRPFISRLEIVSNHLELSGGRWTASFSPAPGCAHGCGTCKPAAMARLNLHGAPTVFVGDGLSDQYAAAHADLVFAKKALAAHCDARKISYTPFDTLHTVSQQLDSLVQRMSPIS